MLGILIVLLTFVAVYAGAVEANGLVLLALGGILLLII